MPMTNLPQTSRNDFANTRWSVVMQQATSETGDGPSALAELAQRFWYPVYAYVRRCGHTPDVAKEITRGFVHHLTDRFCAGDQRPAPGHFRRFLLCELNDFLAGDWRASIQRKDCDHLVPPADLEDRNLRDNAGAASPEAAYQRSFAIEVLERALNKLKDEARQTGHRDMFESLQPYLSHEPVAGEYELIAQRLRMRPMALATALKRLRQRLRELAGRELADTVSSPDDLAAEQAALLSALRNPPKRQ
jgi:RNA polymerase sigma-70 factor (ECF subfamily)